MKVLLSIKPEFAEKILLGQKLYEFRKVLPKDPGVKTIVIYATLPLGKVVGEFDIAEILSDTPRKIWHETADLSGITKRFFNDYFQGREVAHAIKVKKVRRYASPVELSSILASGIAPQSFCYLN
jgi:predicted transcriptional regulator